MQVRLLSLAPNYTCNLEKYNINYHVMENLKFDRVDLDTELRADVDGCSVFRECHEHETLMSFYDDDGNYAFVDWWHEEGSILFNKYYSEWVTK